MARTGRRPATTPDQRDRVLRLLAEGASRRRAAEEVFGDAGLRGRVDRILRSADAPDAGAALERALQRLDDGEDSADHDQAAIPQLEELFALYARSLRRRFEDPNERVTASELQTFARLELWVENNRRLAEMNELARSG